MTTPVVVNPYVEWVSRYRYDAVAYVREVLGENPFPWQAEVLEAYSREVGWETLMSIVSGHRVGKTKLLSWLISHHAAFRFPQKTVVTAATEGQLFRALVPEVKACISRMPEHVRDLFDVRVESIKLRAAPDLSFVTFTASSESNPEALAGAHSEGSVMIVVDEASGVPDVIFEAAGGSLAGENTRMILTGNPVRRNGYFFRTHHELARSPGNDGPGTWRTWHVSSKNNSNVSQDWVKAKALEYGENSNAYRVRVLGEFPISEDDTIISYEVVKAATERTITIAPNTYIVWGLDVAYSGDDRTVLVKRQGKIVKEEPICWWKLEPMQIVGRVKNEWDNTAEKLRPRAIYIDTIIWGMGVYSRLRELGLPVVSVNVSERPAMRSAKYKNLRTELWWRMREWFEARDCQIPMLRDFVEELSAQTYKITESNGTVLATEKKLIKKELGRSPDLADALMLTFCDNAGIMLDSNRNWNEPIRRKIKSVV
jgi:phage terminase large subunit